MLKQQARLVSRGMRLFDMAMLGVAFPIAYYVREAWQGSPRGGLFPISTYVPLLAATLLVWQLASWLSNLYRAYRTLSVLNEVLRLARTFVIVALVMAAGQFVTNQRELSRAFFGLYYSIALMTDATYRAEFLDNVAEELRDLFAARVEYLELRARPGPTS